MHCLIKNSLFEPKLYLERQTITLKDDKNVYGPSDVHIRQI